MSDAGGRFEAIGVGNSLKGAVVLRRGLLGSSTIVHRCRDILLEDAGDRGLAASDPGSNTLLTHALGSEANIISSAAENIVCRQLQHDILCFYVI